MLGFHSRGSPRRRGIVAVQVAVLLVVLLGFAALTVDVGAMYNARNDLQRTADAAALAAAGRLSDWSQGDPMEAARTVASDYTGSNRVFNHDMRLDPGTDVVFGRANYDAGTNRYSFEAVDALPDSVRVQVRMTNDSPNGALRLFFAGLLGHTSTQMSASAIAMMVPRDIVVVADLSGSHTDDSELRHYQDTEVNMFEVWDALPYSKGMNGVGNLSVSPGAGNPAVVPPAHGVGLGSLPGGFVDPGTAANGQQKGPTWGWMYHWGSELDPATYVPSTDPGLLYLPRSAAWTDANLTAGLTNAGYSAAEVAALKAATYDSSKDANNQYGWTNRVAVALGLARWDSGIPGGLWSTLPAGTPMQAGNNNNWPAAGELTWLVPYPFAQGSWNDYIYNYARSTSTFMYTEGSTGFRYRFGLKTFMNYLMETRESHAETPELSDVPTQPMQAVKDSVDRMAQVITDLDTDDQLALVIYGTTVHTEIPLTRTYFDVSNRLREMQAGYYDSYTNIGGGIQGAVTELNSTRARPAARKVIVLLTDGMANVNELGETTSYAGGAAYTTAQAQIAADQGIRIFTVSVGSSADQALMADVAEIGGGDTFHAEGSIEEYSEQLDLIFQELGGRRPVELIQ